MNLFTKKTLLIGATIMTGFVNMCLCQTRNTVRLTRSETASKMPNGSFNRGNSPSILAELMIDTVQKVSDKGITFSIRWVNRSSKTVATHNLLNGIFVTIVNFKDAYSSIVRDPSITNRGARWVLEDQPFEVESVKINGITTNVETIKKETTILSGNSTLECNLSIKKVIKFDKQNPISATNQRALPIIIPKGMYNFRLTVGITSADKESQKISELLTIPTFMVMYGP